MSSVAARPLPIRSVPWRASVAGLVLVLAVTAVAAFRARADLQRAQGDALGAVAAWLGMPIDAETVELDLFPPAVVAHRVRVLGDGHGTTDVAEVDEARLRVALGPLLRGRIEIDDIRLVAPRLRLVRDADGVWNFNLMRRANAMPGVVPGVAPSAPAVIVDSVRVRDGRISYRDRRIPGVSGVEFADLDLRLRAVAAGHSGQFSGRAVDDAGGTIQGEFLLARPDSPATESTLEVRAAGLDAARFPELVSLLRARLPVAVRLDGRVSADMRVQVPAGGWPPTQVRLEVGVDTREATADLGRGAIVKAAGIPLRADFVLSSSDGDLVVERSVLDVAGTTLDFATAASSSGARSTTQGPLVLAPRRLELSTLASLVPALGRIRPRGEITLAGRLLPGGESLAAEVVVLGRDLSAVVDGQPWALDVAGIGLRAAPAQKATEVTVVVGPGRGPAGLGWARFEARISRPDDGPATVAGALTDLARGSGRVDRVAFSLRAEPARIDVVSLDVTGLGGRASARGQAERLADGTWRGAARPEWSGIDVDAVTALAGIELPARGRVTGGARFESAGGTWSEVFDRLTGDVELRVSGGSLKGVNPFRALLTGLEDIPGLREAVERRAGEVAPALVNADSPKLEGDLAGAWRQRRLDVARLELRAPQWTLATRGEIDVDGHTRLAGTLSLDDQVSRALLDGPRILAALGEGGHEISIPLRIRGSYPDLHSEPSPEFLRVALARGLGASEPRGIGSLLRDILGPSGADRAR